MKPGPRPGGKAQKAKCRFTSQPCVFCAHNYTLGANFVPRDDDGDGTPQLNDCDDSNRYKHPGAHDVPDNGVDEDCDGVDAHDNDRDNDGSPDTVDCDDHNAARHPGANEVPDNGVDENCDRVDGHDSDQDDDGYSEIDDCNDHDPKVHPGARDTPRNGVDEDCRNGDNRDADADGYNDPPGNGERRDCNDSNPSVHPDAFDHADNGIDEDCDGKDPERPDRDADGYSRPADCRDDQASIHPDARDIPRNTTDEDCDGKDADYPAVASDIRHSERGKGRFTVFTRLFVTDPPTGATIRLSCRGKGCKIRKKTIRAVPGMDQVSLLRSIRGAQLAPGAQVEITVTAPEMYGKRLRLTVRKGKGPKVAWLKIDPISGKTTRW